jgi:hypothetical protein
MSPCFHNPSAWYARADGLCSQRCNARCRKGLADELLGGDGLVYHIDTEAELVRLSLAFAACGESRRQS